jgi:predicted ATPase
MLTRIEIDGFKTFTGFSLDLQPFTAIVGPNASGKSNLFDALRFLSLLAQGDIRTAMQGLRGEPEELFRRTAHDSVSSEMTFALDVALPRHGIDAFGKAYETPAQRVRYELKLAMARDRDGLPRGIFVKDERCVPLTRRDDGATFFSKAGIRLNYNARINPFVQVNESGDAILVRQDGRQKHGRPMQFPLKEASRTALSTITTSEFPHLYAVREVLTNIRFLEINPKDARAANDRFAGRTLNATASNLAAVLAHLKEETATNLRPDGVLADIATDLTSLIPSIKRLTVRNDPNDRQYSFGLDFKGDLAFSSRVISDGTLRLLAVLTILNDPERRGTLCFEEPENGVHEGRVPILIECLRAATSLPTEDETPFFQILLNTHSPAVMAALRNDEIVAADSVAVIEPNRAATSSKTRMRIGIRNEADLFDPEHHLTRGEVERLLRHPVDAA